MIKKVRESNFELLRIISMLFIVTWHVLIHGNVINQTSGALNLFMNLLVMFVIVHVSLFMLITGYYQSQSKFRLKKLLSLLLQILFYNFVINTILYVTGVVKYANIDYIKNILFYNISSYWYIQCYIIVYMLSPFLNKIVEVFKRVELKKIILVLFCCFSVFPFLSKGLFYQTTGFTVSQYILLYFIGAYIRKYDLNKNFLNKFNINQKQIIYISIFIISWIINVMLFYFSQYLNSIDSNILRYYGSAISLYKYFYSNPLVIIQAVSLFLLFGTFSFKNKFINKLGSLMLGVYLIHESQPLKENIYIWLGIDKGKMIYSNYIIIKLFYVILIIFGLCVVIEFIRKLIFKLIYKFNFIKSIYSKLIAFLQNVINV